MSGFSPAWLALREAADHRARNASLAEALRSRFLQRETITVVDLAAGTGSNLRAVAPLLPAQQSWTLVDHDLVLLAAARDALARWAETCTPHGKCLSLSKGAITLEVTFHQADLARELDGALVAGSKPGPDLVTASALFDLTSPDFIRRFAASVAKRRAVFYSSLTYNGLQSWTPRQPADQQITSAFHRHMMTDKGFGIAAGPTAAIELSEAFTAQGYSVSEGNSPWRLNAGDAELVAELSRGVAAAVSTTGALPPREIEVWLARGHKGAGVGHTDTLAFPGSASDMDMAGDED